MVMVLTMAVIYDGDRDSNDDDNDGYNDGGDDGYDDDGSPFSHWMPCALMPHSVQSPPSALTEHSRHQRFLAFFLG